MKKNIFAVAAALCLLIGTSASAQNQNGHQSRMMKERPTAEQMAQRKADRLKEKLTLTDAQTKQVYELNLQQIKAMQAQREQMRAARQAETNKMKSILTPEQFAKWQEMQGEHKPYPAKMHKDGKGCKEAGCCKHAQKDGKDACCDAKNKKKK